MSDLSKKKFWEMMGIKKPVGYQNETEVDTACKLLSRESLEHVRNIFAESKGKLGEKYDDWESLMENGEKMYILISDITRDVSMVKLTEIKFFTMPEKHGQVYTWIPAIMFNVE